MSEKKKNDRLRAPEPDKTVNIRKSASSARPQAAGRYRPPMSEAERKRRIKIREKRRRKRRIRAILLRLAVLAFILLVLFGGIYLICRGISSHKAKKEAEIREREEALLAEQAKKQKRADTVAEAEKLASGYDYDRAVALLKTLDGYEEDEDVMKTILSFEIKKSSLVPVEMNEVTHIFYHSLIVDPARAFSDDSFLTAGFKQWMTTIDEFNKITQAMYDNGYVLVDLHDIAEETVGEDGKVHFAVNQIMLPEGKKPFVLSLDDLCYYHSYDGRGIASKIVLDGSGKPQCEYIQPDGKKVVGAYDCVPLLDKFIEEHPGSSYKGAKGTIALTGYNGILGYRTDIAYKTRENLSEDQAVWLQAHPDFDWDKECAEAKKVAEALKKDGWRFANHTWGHIGVGDSASLEYLKTDNEKWMKYVSPLIGETDTVMFAFGQDIADWHDYSSDNEKFNYYKSRGFNYFCNVDSTPYYLQVRDNYVRQSRRNLDGYRLWHDAHGITDYTADLFDASEILDPSRTDMPGL